MTRTTIARYESESFDKAVGKPKLINDNIETYCGMFEKEYGLFSSVHTAMLMMIRFIYAYKSARKMFRTDFSYSSYTGQHYRLISAA